MGDAAAAAAATAAEASTSSAPDDTPTSILICREDGTDLLADADDDVADVDAELVVARDERLLVVDPDEEYLTLLLSEESVSGVDGGGGGGDPAAEEMEDWMKAARSGCVRWIIKTTAAFRCGGKTAYVAVTYLDRFLALRRVNRGQEWALRLLAAACLSLAIKMEELHAPRLSEFPVDEPYEFDTGSVLRMELLVLSTLEWRMAAVTPFSYLSCFAARFREHERRPILLRAVECIFAAIKATSSAEYRPSTVAVASILVARGREEGNLDALKAALGSSCPRLDTEHVYSCYRAMAQEDDKSPTRSTSSTGVASSGVSVFVAAHAGSGSPSPSPGVSVGANNAAGTATPAAAPDEHSNNKRRRFRSPQRQ